MSTDGEKHVHKQHLFIMALEIIIFCIQRTPQGNKKNAKEEGPERKGSKDYHYYRYCPVQGCTLLHLTKDLELAW